MRSQSISLCISKERQWYFRQNMKNSNFRNVYNWFANRTLKQKVAHDCSHQVLMSFLHTGCASITHFPLTRAILHTIICKNKIKSYGQTVWQTHIYNSKGRSSKKNQIPSDPVWQSVTQMKTPPTAPQDFLARKNSLRKSGLPQTHWDTLLWHSSAGIKCVYYHCHRARWSL